jgi:transposase InsO family protein
MILDYINQTVQRSEVKREWVLDLLGLASSTYYRWLRMQSRGSLEDIAPLMINLDAILPEEVEAVINYALEHPKEGYRRLAYMMIDEDVVFLSPSSIYRILSFYDLLKRYKRSSRSNGNYSFNPEKPHDQWHLDILYLWVRSRWYFFVGIIDAYSRYIVHWELLDIASSDAVTAVLHTGLKKYPSESPRIVTDNGPQFTSKDFRYLLKEFALLDIKIRIRHPESNGIIERFHRSLRDEAISEHSLKDKYKALSIIEKWVNYYNHERLHASLKYLRPVDYLTGVQEELLQIRREKLKAASRKRRAENQKLIQERNVKEPKCGGSPAPTPPGFIALGDTCVIINNSITQAPKGYGNYYTVRRTLRRSGSVPGEPYPPKGAER